VLFPRQSDSSASYLLFLTGRRYKASQRPRITPTLAVRRPQWRSLGPSAPLRKPSQCSGFSRIALGLKGPITGSSRRIGRRDAPRSTVGTGPVPRLIERDSPSVVSERQPDNFPNRPNLSPDVTYSRERFLRWLLRHGQAANGTTLTGHVRRDDQCSE